MKLYKYKSLQNLWHVLDIVVNRRLFCAHWSELNDPLEGRYEIYLGESSSRLAEKMVTRIEGAKDRYRVASLSADSTNFLLWSHYADGHKGVAIEVEIPDGHPDLIEVNYTPFSSVFTSSGDTKEDMRHLFNGKGEEWAYENEYRVVVESQFFLLPSPVTRILLGPRVSPDQEDILLATLPSSVEVIRTELDQNQGTLIVSSSAPSIQRMAAAGH